MCGIVGVVSKNDVSKYSKFVSNALKIIKHRGPDDTKVYTREHVCFGYVRLAIRGDGPKYEQPIENANFVAFGNGEVYSKKNRKVSSKKNDLFPLIRDLLKYREKIFSMYDADFAVSCYEKKSNVFWLARDMFGVKPLYYTWLEDNTLAFASEIKALKILLNKRYTFESEAIVDYLLFGYPLENKTFYSKIYCLPPGSIMEWKLDSNNISEYLSGVEKINIHNGNSKKSILIPLKAALKTRMISDRKLGFHLSGGKDSSLLAYVNSKLSSQNVDDFFSVFNTEEDNDLKYSKAISKILNGKLQTIRLPYEKNYEELIRILDSPIMSTGAAVPYEIAKLSSQSGNIVLIAGQGADELFLGYDRFKELKKCLTKYEAFEILFEKF